jgi:hypothetical protein
LLQAEGERREMMDWGRVIPRQEGTQGGVTIPDDAWC